MEILADQIDPAIRDFYASHRNAQKFLTLRHNPAVPLRLIAWFCSVYCRDVPVVYMLGGRGRREEVFNVYHSYRAYLRSYKKKEFDPINRGCPVTVVYRSPTFRDGEPTRVVTSVCQLVFFRWYISNMVYMYLARHRDEIDRARRCESDGTPRSISSSTASSNSSSSGGSGVSMITPLELYVRGDAAVVGVTSRTGLTEIYEASLAVPIEQSA